MEQIKQINKEVVKSEIEFFGLRYENPITYCGILCPIAIWKRSLVLKQLFVFDLDGTLINSLEDLAESTNRALAQNGFPQYPAQRYRTFVGDGVGMLVKRALGSAATPENEEKILAGFNREYAAHYADHTRPYPGIPGALLALAQKGVRCAVLSNKPDHFVKEIVARMFPGFSFAWVQGKAEGFARKPDPASLLHILQSLAAPKEGVLYIGDSNVDIETGKRAGVETCGVTWGFRGRAELEAAGASYVAQTPGELPALA